MLIADFEKHFLSGFPCIQEHNKNLNYLKKRLDGFIYAGRDTYTKVVNDFIESGKPLLYHHHNLHLRLNQVTKPEFTFDCEVNAFSAKVAQAREALFQKYGFEKI